MATQATGAANSLEKRCLFRSELLQEIAECESPSPCANHGLLTVDQAPCHAKNEINGPFPTINATNVDKPIYGYGCF